MNGVEVMFSSKNTEWGTPQWLFDELDSIYHFETDVYATPENAKCKRFFTKEQDGLKQEWTGVCWCNPPYGKGITVEWVKKAYESRAKTVMLLPVRTDTKWFHDYIVGQVGVSMMFLKKRIKFNGANNYAPFPCMIVVFDRFREGDKK